MKKLPFARRKFCAAFFLPPVPSTPSRCRKIALSQVFHAAADRPPGLDERGAGRFGPPLLRPSIRENLHRQKRFRRRRCEGVFQHRDRIRISDNEDGLLSIAFHPGFKTNGLFYVYYNQENNAEQAQKFQRRRIPLPQRHQRIQGVRHQRRCGRHGQRTHFVRVPQPFPNHKGGELASAPTVIFISALGDGGSGRRPARQRPEPFHPAGQNAAH
jgi:hypothetical protein